MAETETLAILFTDIVGSTELSTSVAPDVADAVRREHFAVLRQVVAGQGGTEVKNLGDGIMVAFKSPSSAVAAAVEMQQEVDLTNRRAGRHLGLRVGVSGGEVVVDDGDYFGDAVVEAARLCALCDGGQVLVSDVVRALAGRRVSHEFVDLGERTLKGMPEPVHVYEVAWEPVAVIGGVPLPERVQVASSSLAAFVGRRDELSVLRSGLKGLVEGERRTVLLAGEPGIGKTTLSCKVAHLAHGDGMVVLYGRCNEDFTISYQPFAEALAHLVRHVGADVLAEHVEQWGGALLPLVPDLERRCPGLSPPRSGDPEADRLALFSAVVSLLAAVSGDNGLVLILDDLHWADRSSLQLLRHVASSAQLERVLVIGTYRDSELSTGHPLADTVASLRREAHVDRLQLAGMEGSEILEMMERMAGHELEPIGVELAHQVRRETLGNPFFATEMLRHLSESGVVFQDETGRWSPSDELGTFALPHSVRDVIGQRVDRLGHETRRVLSCAAVIGREFDLAVLAEVADLGEDELFDLIERAAGAGLLRESETTVDRFGFAHALTQRALHDELGASRRARTHRKVAEVLESRGGATSPAELALHYVAATRSVDSSKALSYSRKAGDEALLKLAPADAASWYAQALELYRQVDPDHALYCDLLIALGTAQGRSGDLSSRETLLEAGTLARQLDDTDLFVAAALANSRGGVSVAGQLDTERIAMLEEALARLPDSPTDERALLLATLSAELSYTDERDRLDQVATAAIEMARQLDDPATHMRVVSLVYHGHVVPHNVHQRLADLADALRLATSADPAAVLHLHNSRAIACLQAGDGPGFDHHVAECAALARRFEQPFERWTATVLRCNQAIVRADLEAAEALANEAMAVAGDSVTEALTAYGVELIEMRRIQGRIAELDGMIGAIANAADENPGLPVLQLVVARLYCELGRLDEARATNAEAIALGEFPFPYDYAWLPGLLTLTPVLIALELDGGARATYDQLLPWADQVATVGVTSEGPVSLALADLAAFLGDAAAAEAHYLRAIEVADGVSAPWWRVQARCGLARLLRSAGHPRAEAVFAEAQADAERHRLAHALG